VRTPTGSEAAQVKALGDATVDDLRQGRLLSAYRLTTKAYREKVPREKFEEMVRQRSSVHSVLTNPAQRETKVRRATEGVGYEYYCTSSRTNAAGLVNFAFTFVPADGGWRIEELDISEVK
jgi:hypothetical protein